jgi:hypothetical protein
MPVHECLLDSCWTATDRFRLSGILLALPRGLEPLFSQ